MVGDEKSRIADSQKADGDETRDFLREILVELKGVAALLKRRGDEEAGNEGEAGEGESVKCDVKGKGPAQNLSEVPSDKLDQSSKSAELIQDQLKRPFDQAVKVRTLLLLPSFMFQELWMMPMPKGPEQARLYVKELRTAIDSKSSIARNMTIVDHFDDETRQMYFVNPCNDEASQMILDPDETPKDLDDIAVVESPSSTGIPEERYQTLGN
ncbi:uncharacterized protein K444DRAFT_713665 [Hyaloscypha bicolor E]|uniref:Uncharacterized protein n=1 Tax=Hyaloscypha bicolor E TaxID=1095630 RepID=A0A2J6TN56_9HELO|nr:uncharacterized protein K444DRAFT_713665 [Hyaloscypha bicolor E]PMD64456.1 hypothetical protein K444DRAFT_713665 [Hyaloscypha bicolor E]